MSEAAASPAGHSSSVDTEHWRARLDTLISSYDVPGAALGILHDGQIHAVAAGVLSRGTLAEATPDSLFDSGSISKVWTTTLAMQLVDQGALALDTPVAQVLPEFAVADSVVSRSTTLWHLLTHTSGIDGDIFLDTGCGDDCLERYVAELVHIGQVHPVGLTFSYCNSGFMVAGRLVEVLTGTTWETAIRERLIDPLRLGSTTPTVDERIAYRAAVGHSVVGSEQAPLPASAMPRSAGPATGIVTTVRDLLAFTQMHLSGGVAVDGTRVLSAGSAQEMADWQVDLPDRTKADSWGLGWMRLNWNGHLLIGHDGGNMGQVAFLRIMPEKRFAVALFTNGGDAYGLYHDLFAEVFSALADVTMPGPVAPPAEPMSIDPGPYLGRYERTGFEAEVQQRNGRLTLRWGSTGSIAKLVGGGFVEQPLVPVGEGRFVTRPEGASTWDPVLAYSLCDGTRYLHFHGFRAYQGVTAR